jgi:hypothetical protein
MPALEAVTRAVSSANYSILPSTRPSTTAKHSIALAALSFNSSCCLRSMLFSIHGCMIVMALAVIYTQERHIAMIRSASLTGESTRLYPSMTWST